MKASKMIALVVLSVLSVLTFNFALKLATDGLLARDSDDAAALAAAPAETPDRILAPATGTPSVAEGMESAESAGTWGDDAFGAPNFDFGQASPAFGEPAWGAADRARQAAATAAAAESLPGAGNGS